VGKVATEAGGWQVIRFEERRHRAEIRRVRRLELEWTAAKPASRLELAALVAGRVAHSTLSDLLDEILAAPDVRARSRAPLRQRNEQ